jgi:hypothetical protein
MLLYNNVAQLRHFLAGTFPSKIREERSFPEDETPLMGTVPPLPSEQRRKLRRAQ